jgi:hypothetical protein
VLTLSSAGTNVTGYADQGGLLSVAFGGDIQVTAQLASLSTGAAARAGLMLRDGDTAGSRGVFLMAGPLGSQVASLLVRTQAQNSSSVSSVSLAAGPVWLRLVRFGIAVSAYTSTNGASWSLIGTASVTMNASFKAGLAVSSGAADSPAQAVFQNVLVEPLNASYEEWQSWVFGARGVTNTAMTLSGADPDGDGRSNLAEFFLGTDPLAADASPAVSIAGPLIRLRFTERKNAASLGRRFWLSSDLRAWSEVTPASTTDLQDFGSRVIREATFPALTAQGFYRAAYSP